MGSLRRFPETKRIFTEPVSRSVRPSLPCYGQHQRHRQVADSLGNSSALRGCKRVVASRIAGDLKKRRQRMVDSRRI
jgi:hypothetical protein